MKHLPTYFCLCLLLLLSWHCGPGTLAGQSGQALDTLLQTGAEQTERYVPDLLGRRVGLVVNHSSRIGSTHLVDSLARLGVDIAVIFTPEHGYRGDADAGAAIKDGRDVRIGARIVSLYGKKKKPSADDLAELDVLVFDIQDVGARFYTYISTLHYVMQACAEQGKPLLVLDRPNPNGHYVDGPLLDPAHSSFVGMHPVPVVHGLTVAEYARMINGEGWLGEGLRCDLRVLPCRNYDHQTAYALPVPPSPNLPNMRSVYLYPSLCFFEGSSYSVGRGTPWPFQVFGHPDAQGMAFSFVPAPLPGASQPKLNGRRCYGRDLSALSPDSLRALARLDLSYLLEAYQALPDRQDFFLSNLFFDKLAGGETLRRQILNGMTAEEIRATWQDGLRAFRDKRRPYLLYPDAAD